MGSARPATWSVQTSIVHLLEMATRTHMFRSRPFPPSKKATIPLTHPKVRLSLTILQRFAKPNLTCHGLMAGVCSSQRIVRPPGAKHRIRLPASACCFFRLMSGIEEINQGNANNLDAMWPVLSPPTRKASGQSTLQGVISA